MDIRDIKNPEQPKNTLEEMFRLQQELLDQYTAIEKMPAYPLKLDLKASQTIIKDFAARVVEELGEAYESYEKMYHIISDLVLLAQHEIITIAELPQEFSNNIYNFSEELSDALHFYLELFLLLGINYKDFTKLCVKYGWIPTDEYGVRTGDLLNCGRKLNEQHLVHSEEAPTIKVEVPIENQVIPGGDSMLCGTYFIIDISNINMPQMLWAVTYDLQLVRNELKNKPWKQTGVLTDTNRFTQILVQGFINLFGILAESKMSQAGIFNLYYKKNQVNLFRIKSRY